MEAPGATGPLSAGSCCRHWTSGLLVGRRSSRRLCRRHDGALYQKTYTGRRGPAGNPSAGQLTSSPAATSPASGVIDVFVRGTDSALYEKTYSTAAGPAGRPSAVCPRPRRKLFVTFPKQDQRGPTRGRQAQAITRTSAPPAYFRPNQTATLYWGDIGKNDFIYIPAGSATNNQNVASWEIGFHFTGIVSGQRFQKIWDKACGGFIFEIDTSLGR